MLCLTRKRNEKLFIGSDVVVTVLEVGKGKVRLGVTAPTDVAIHREEIYLDLGANRIPSKNHVCSHPDAGSGVYQCRLLDCPVHGPRNRVMNVSPKAEDVR